jgi:enoyl-CoA hydratase/carnithine racemase
MSHPAAPTSFRLEEKDAVATITLDRPDKGNALTFTVYEELRDAFKTLGARADLRVIVVTGAGRFFCTGGDVNEIIGPLFQRDMRGLLDFTRLTCDLIGSMRTCPIPIVASLNGTVAGAGAVIALASDFRVAATEAKIAFLFAKVGLAGADMGAAYLLPKVVGHGRATEILMLGDFVSAADAERFGLYNKVVPREQLEATTHELVARLRAGPAFATRMTKTMIDREAQMSLEQALEAEAQAQAICMQHPDYRTAYEAFVRKEKPVFWTPGAAP